LGGAGGFAGEGAGVPITYRVDHDRKLVVARGYGVFLAGDIFGYQRDVWSRDDVAGYDELVDMTYVSEVDLPSAQRIRDLASVAAGMDVRSSPSRFAIVAPSDLIYGLGRMFQVYRESEPRSSKAVGVFRTIAEAVAFLNLADVPPLPPVPVSAASGTG
jgi:hypothetical protein